MSGSPNIKGKSSSGGPKGISKNGIKNGKISSKAKLKIKIKDMLRSGHFGNLSRKDKIK